MSVKIDKVLLAHVLDNQTTLVSTCLEFGVFDESDVSNLWHVDGTVEKRSVEQWYLVTEWLGKQLAALDVPVLSNEYGMWWGRQTDDPVTDCLAPDVMKLVMAL